MRKKSEQPNIVETYHFGGSIVHIADNSILRDTKEIEKTIDEFHEIGWSIIRECRERGEDI